MKLIGKILCYPLLLVNGIVAVLLIASGWSSFLFVKSFPVISLLGMAFPVILALNLLFILFWLIFHKRGMWLSVTAVIAVIVPLFWYCPLNIRNTDSGTDSGQDITLLSYNIFGFCIASGNREDSTNPIIRYIADADADIVCLQESYSKYYPKARSCCIENLPELKYSYSNKTNTIVSRWPILDSREIKFSDSGNGLLYCRLLKDNDTIALYNCHLQSFELKQDEIDGYNRLIANPNDSTSYSEAKSVLKKLKTASAKRALQADTILTMLNAETAKYVILCGDFNDTPLSYSRRVIAKKLTDAYVSCGFGPGISYNLNRLYFRIDHVFCSGNITPLSCRIDRSIKESDHYPVITHLRLQ
ncbi:MAG: endonuclease/exonuclease/phosphatase family protein [Bacteroidaceae bacterium]|nr:endonuclease/exonuclease/phosphatase family protein [Bacteroidaceae bacterium]